MNRKDAAYILLGLLIVTIPADIFAFNLVAMQSKSAKVYIYEGLPEGAHYTSSVVAIWRHADGTIYNVAVVHNVLTDLGKGLIKTALSAASNTTGVNALSFIAITNATFTAASTHTSCCGGLNTASVLQNYGLAPAAATYASTGSGTWTITKTFTYDGTASTQTIHGAGLMISTGVATNAANLFAEATFSTTAPLSAKERITPLG